MVGAEGKGNHRPYLYQIGDTFKTQHGIMTVVNRFRIHWNNKVFRKLYTLQCEKGHQYDVKEDYLSAGRLRTCKKCNHPTIMEADPEFAAWFVDQSIPCECSCGCHDKADFYCQQCGRIVQGKCIKNIHKRRQVPCPYCGNGVSYPERYIIALLEQLQIPFVHQYTVEFMQNEDTVHYKYDFYDPERKLIIETHGLQHYEPGIFERIGGYSLEKIQQIDLEKARYAIQVLHLDYVALDCRLSDPDWIRKEATRKLDCYPLNTIDWDLVRRNANKSVVLQIIDLRKQGYSLQQIGNAVHMNATTVSIKLKNARKDGLFDGITPQSLREEENKRLQKEKQERLQMEKERREVLRKIKNQHRAEKKARKMAAWKMVKNNNCHHIEKISASRRHQGEKKFFSLLPEFERRGYSYAGESFQGFGKQNAFRCSHCGQIWWTTASSILKGRNHICISPCRKKTPEEFVQQVCALVGNEYSVLEEYTTAFTPIKIRHNNCGLEYFVAPVHFTSTGRRCPVCTKNGLERDRGAQKLHLEQSQALYKEWEQTFRAGNQKGILSYIWDRKCADVAAFRIQHGHSDIPYGYMVRGYHLGGWLSEQRKLYSCGRLSADRMQRLESLGVKWNCKEDSWSRTYEAVRKYLQEYGFVHLSKSSTKEERKYYYWIQDQIKRGRKGRVSAEKTALLSAIGIVFDYYADIQFETMCDKLRCFVEEHGHCIVPQAEEKGEDLPLGSWAKRMRWQLSAGTLPADQAARLIQLGLPDSNRTAKFQHKLACLTDYYKKHGHLQIPQSYAENGQRLGKWINSLRVRYAKDSLTIEQISALEAIGMVWKPDKKRK